MCIDGRIKYLDVAADKLVEKMLLLPSTYTYFVLTQKQIILVTVAKQNCWLLFSNVTPGNLGNFRLLAYIGIFCL